MDELLAQFLIEGRELVQQASDDLLALEREGHNAARLDSAFRAVHTLKGSVGLFDLAPMGRALHAAEDLLEAVRARRVRADSGFLDLLLACLGACEGWLDVFGRQGALPASAPEQCRQLEAGLRLFLSGAQEAGNRPAASTAPVDWAAALAATQDDAVRAAQAAGLTVTALRYLPGADCFFLGDDPLALLRGLPELIALRVEPREPWPTPAEYSPFACNLSMEALSTATLEEIRRVFRFVPDQVALAELPAAAAADAAVAVDGAGEASARVLRVDAARIDQLLDMVGEMMVAKNTLAGLAPRVGAIDAGLGRALADNQAAMGRLAGEMHRAVIGMRMVPLAQTFRRFPRLMRETAAELGKPIDFQIQGDEVEADKAVVEGLFQPLLHLLRNAVDHGIESAPRRDAAAKPATGQVTLRASRRGDQILVTVRDDGAGLDPAALREAALRRGFSTPEAIGALDDAAALNLIFAPGFSTASTVTSLSGRGVGMDAVRAAVEELGGRVSLASEPGHGTTVQLVLPRATVITTVVTVRLGEEQFGVPIEAVTETLRLPVAMIQPVGSGEAFVSRGRTLPLLRLSTLLGFPPVQRHGATAKLLVVACGQQHVGIEVDGFSDRTDLLLRPMSGLLAGVAGLLGTALLADGRVLLVLDLPELVG
jgi:two-component system chemotaxis sensor kinase CheA